jgi:hypothetical protein
MVEIPEPIALVIDQAIEHVYSFEPLVAKTVILGKCRLFIFWLMEMCNS